MELFGCSHNMGDCNRGRDIHHRSRPVDRRNTTVCCSSTAVNVVELLIFAGEKKNRVSNDHRTIAGWQIFGNPQLFADRVILTPPVPGNQRVGVWSNAPNPYDEWSTTLEFRSSGSERAGGSLHLWYTLNGAKGGSGLGMDSVYTSKPWDGLALVVDSHSGVWA